MKVKVKMRTTFADEVQTASPGQVIEVSIQQARELIAGQYAEPVGISAQAIMEGRIGARPAARETATTQPAETRAPAAPAAAEQSAAKPAGKGGGKKGGSKIQPPQP